MRCEEDANKFHQALDFRRLDPLYRVSKQGPFSQPERIEVARVLCNLTPLAKLMVLLYWPLLPLLR